MCMLPVYLFGTALRPDMDKKVNSSLMYDCADCGCCGVLCYTRGHNPVVCGCGNLCDMDVRDSSLEEDNVVGFHNSFMGQETSCYYEVSLWVEI